MTKKAATTKKAAAPKATTKKTTEKKAVAVKDTSKKTTDEPVKLTGAERKELKRLENKIRTASKSWLTIGECLFDIAIKKLYREEYKSFAEYVAEVWDYTDRRYAYRIVSGTQIVNSLKAEGFEVLPEIESQARPMEKYLTIDYNTGQIDVLPMMIKIWTCVTERFKAGDIKITAKVINGCVAEIDKDSKQAKDAKKKADEKSLRDKVIAAGEMKEGAKVVDPQQKAGVLDAVNQMKAEKDSAVEQLRAQKAKVKKLQDIVDNQKDIIEDLKELLTNNGIDFSAVID